MLTRKDYILIAVITLAELPGQISLMSITHKVGIKILLVVYFILISVTLAVIVTPFFGNFIKIANALGRFVNSRTISLVWVFISESFPVTVRATALGLAQGGGKAFLLAVPFLVQWLMHISVFWVLFVTISLCVIGTIE